MTKDTIFKRKKATNRFISPKNNLKVNMVVKFTNKVSKSLFEVYMIGKKKKYGEFMDVTGLYINHIFFV